MKRLTNPSGELVAHLENSLPSGSDDSLVRSAILVHSNKNGKPMVFQSADGPIEFDEARIKNIIKQHNKMISKLAEQYGGLEKMPIGAFPPILDQHEDDSTHRVSGRLNNLLRFERRDVPGVGENCACVVTDITFLGKHVVERVNDGRIYHLSIGIDEATDTLGEVSTVINPAAPGAMLLNKQKKTANNDKLGGEKKMSKVSKLQAHFARLEKLKAIQEGVKQSQSKLVGAKKQIELSAKTAKVTKRLSGLMESKKLTPAEFKKVDIKKLAKLDDETLETVLSAYDMREPVIMSGQRGSTNASSASEIAMSLEKRQLKSLKSEVIKDMKRMGKSVKLSEGLDDEVEKKMSEQDYGKEKELEEKPMPVGKDEHVVPGQISAHLKHLGECLDSGDIEKAKEHHAALCKMAEGWPEKKEMQEGDAQDPEHSEKEMSGMQSQVDELNTQMARLAGMVEELMSAEKDEGAELSEEAEYEEKAKKELEKQIEESK